jgi:hypothetical protein
MAAVMGISTCTTGNGDVGPTNQTGHPAVVFPGDVGGRTFSARVHDDHWRAFHRRQGSVVAHAPEGDELAWRHPALKRHALDASINQILHIFLVASSAA